MNNNAWKMLVLAGCLAASQGAVAHQDEDPNHTHENTFAAGCGKKCGGGRTAPNNGRMLTPEEEQQMQNQGQGHSCGAPNQPRPYQQG